MEDKKKPLVLLIDDDTMLHKLIGAILSKAGYEAISAYSGEEGLRLAQSEKPELIILDIMMPGLDGFEVMRLLQADTVLAGIPVIFLSGKIYPTDKMQARDLGAADFIEKPFDRSELLARVNTYIKLRRQEEVLSFYVEQFSRLVEEGLSTLHRSGRFTLETLPEQLVKNISQASREAVALGRLLESRWRPLAPYLAPYLKGQAPEEMRRTFEDIPRSLDALNNSLEKFERLVVRLESLERLARYGDLELEQCFAAPAEKRPETH